MKHFVVLLLLSPVLAFAQKKPLDHTVYDCWQSIGEKLISNNGKWVIYTVTPQEGDADLFIQSVDGSNFKQQIPRGYNAVITEDSRFAIFKIKPVYKDTRDARIKKKKPEEMPKDSIAIVELGKDEVFKLPNVKSFKTPVKAFGWVAYQKEIPASKQTAPSTQKTVDSLKKKIDSLNFLLTELKNTKSGSKDVWDAEDDPATTATAVEGSDLVLRNLLNTKEKTFKNVADYSFDPNGQKLVMRLVKSAKDSSSANAVILYDLKRALLDTILKNGNDFRNFAFSEDGTKLAFLAERDTNRKALQRFYDLYLYRAGSDSAIVLVNKHSVGMQIGYTVSEHGTLTFSKTGNRLLFGTGPIQPPKDTSLVEIDLVKLDIWNYKDDYLQTQQLNRLAFDLKRNYLAVYDFSKGIMRQLGSEGLPTVLPTNEGDGDYFLATTDTGRRVEAQWTGNTKKDVYAVNVNTGERILVKKNHDGLVYPSSTGKYILLYDNKTRNYFTWDASAKPATALRNITSKIKVPLYDEQFDMPDDPNPHGIMGWHQGDSAVYIYDRYDVWKVDPLGMSTPKNITSQLGRATKESYRYVRLNPEERYFKKHQPIYFRYLNDKTKETGFRSDSLSDEMFLLPITKESDFVYGPPVKAKYSSQLIYTKENYTNSPNLYLHSGAVVVGSHTNYKVEVKEQKLTSLNPQQSQYNWGTAQLYHWKTFNGKDATGILYKPGDFDSTKKYPMIIYFYERLSDGLYNYIAPAPTASRLNIPFFVSRGYLVFAPDIVYTKGHPGKDAYNYVVSGAQSLAKKKWVDGKNIGIQGQSWGGYQVAYLVTATNMFKAAWAGAPVVNMFSAYGGIRWESGNNRQSQYEKGQSRIGATPWDRPDLYIENSPFFHLKNITTPLVIMSNDADGAVPWYQGIEFFTAMRRLNKKVWLLNYNGEAHNLVERKNRKDIQLREQQYFDWLLKGEAPPKWITDGVPAVKKGKDWGFEQVF
ncbi:MAG: alpha/beta hydrolase family protein [Flavisolibacter sp.]